MAFQSSSPTSTPLERGPVMSTGSWAAAVSSSGRFIEQPVQLLAGLTGTDCVHVQEPTHSGHKKHGVELESSRCFGQCELHTRGQAESDEIIRRIEVVLSRFVDNPDRKSTRLN